MKWEDEIIKIIERKENADLKEAAKLFRAAGRSGPCNHFHPFPPQCGLKQELDCLTCPHYQPQEIGGNLGQGFARYENGKVVHLVGDIESDGYYRSGVCLCNRLPDEEVDAVEIYPADTFEEIVEEFGEDNICKICLKAFKEDNPR
jgi:bacterioferritin-associated ferredoxin